VADGTNVKRIVIVGAGGQGAIVADILQRCDITPVAFVDDDASRIGSKVLGIEVAASLHRIPHDAIIVAIGDNHTRRAITERLIAAGEALTSAIHPFTSIAPSAAIGEGSMISAGAIVSPRATIGRGVLLNTNASVDHDTIVGDFAHLSAAATVGALCRIGEESLIALGASVRSGRTLGTRTILGAGAVAVDDIPNDVIALGIPARVTSDRRSATPNR
jgi:sugar O-acyltransferase (sialic acid O-acetyltransferase NeuD family)